jgi:hypothetical protein
VESLIKDVLDTGLQRNRNLVCGRTTLCSGRMEELPQQVC